MINVIADLIQPAAILCWAILMISLVRRVNRLDKRLDLNSIAIAQVRESSVGESEEPKAICGCGHHQCFHDETGCGNTDMHLAWSSSNSMPERYPVPCGCKRYTGPEQLPTVIP